jgi:UPF0716 protein FxsA
MALLAPFLLVPVVELLVFVLVSLLVGFWTAFALLLGGSLAGAILLRLSGAAVLRQARRQMERQQPGAGVLDGLWLAVAGVLLFLPGFVTDLLAITLLLPPLRRILFGPVIRRLHLWLSRRAAASARSTRPSEPSPAPPEPHRETLTMPPGPIIDVDFEDLPPKPPA